MIQIYTGEGKGKTTAAVGLTIRAVGHGKRVYFAQFMKAWPTGELEILQQLDGVIIDRSWDGHFVKDEPTPLQIRLVKAQYQRILAAFFKPFDLIVCDEIIVTHLFGLLEEGEILELMEALPKDKELVLTGRGATVAMIQKADLVSHIQKIKHYFDKGVRAREGIEF